MALKEELGSFEDKAVPSVYNISYFAFRTTYFDNFIFNLSGRRILSRTGYSLASLGFWAFICECIVT